MKLQDGRNTCSFPPRLSPKQWRQKRKKAYCSTGAEIRFLWHNTSHHVSITFRNTGSNEVQFPKDLCLMAAWLGSLIKSKAPNEALPVNGAFIRSWVDSLEFNKRKPVLQYFLLKGHFRSFSRNWINILYGTCRNLIAVKAIFLCKFVGNQPKILVCCILVRWIFTPTDWGNTSSSWYSWKMFYLKSLALVHVAIFRVLGSAFTKRMTSSTKEDTGQLTLM